MPVRSASSYDTAKSGRLKIRQRTINTFLLEWISYRFHWSFNEEVLNHLPRSQASGTDACNDGSNNYWKGFVD